MEFPFRRFVPFAVSGYLNRGHRRGDKAQANLEELAGMGRSGLCADGRERGQDTTRFPQGRASKYDKPQY